MIRVAPYKRVWNQFNFERSCISNSELDKYIGPMTLHAEDLVKPYKEEAANDLAKQTRADEEELEAKKAKSKQ